MVGGVARAGGSGVAAEIVSEYPRVLPLMLLLVIVLVLDPLRLRLQA